MKEVYKGMLMSVPEMQRKCVAGVRTTAHGPDQNNAEPVEHVGSREQIGPGLSQPGTAARDPGRVKTFFLPQKLHAAGRNPRRRDRLSLFLLYRVRSQSGRNLAPRRTT
jgi:hypothetical protein